MINLDVCIICGSSENLNTSMTINIDGEEITIKICDTDADTATPKQVKECYLSKKAEIDEIIAKAKELGLEVNVPQSPSSIATIKKPKSKSLAESPPSERSDPTQPALDPAIAAAIKGSKEDGILSTNVVDNIVQRVRSAAGGESGAESHSAYVPGSGQDKLDPALLEGKVKMEAAEGRDGQPIAVPAVRVDQTGTTTVRVKQDMDDATLQRRFKEHAGSASAGYDVHNCPICRGDGVIKQRGNLDTCPKCSGSGLLSK